MTSEMGSTQSVVISEDSPRQIRLTFPNKKHIVFVHGKRNTEGEILSDRDFFYFSLFRCLELNCWKHDRIMRTISPGGGSPKASPRNSPRLRRMDSVMQLTAEFRETPSNNKPPEYLDKSKYQSELKAEILDVVNRLIGEYVQIKDTGRISLAIDTYISDLKTDNIPHYVNYRPNPKSDLSIQLAFSLHLYKGWLCLPHAWLYPHEWVYLLQQGIRLLDKINKEPTSLEILSNNETVDRSRRYLDVLIDNERRLKAEEFLKNDKLPTYTFKLIMDSVLLPCDEDKEYIGQLVKTLKYDDGTVSATIITWHNTFK